MPPQAGLAGRNTAGEEREAAALGEKRGRAGMEVARGGKGGQVGCAGA